jgi:hypothetical protein
MEYFSQKMFWSPLNGLVFYRDITKVEISSFNISELRRLNIDFLGNCYLVPSTFRRGKSEYYVAEKINVITITYVRIYNFISLGKGGTADILESGFN